MVRLLTCGPLKLSIGAYESRPTRKRAQCRGHASRARKEVGSAPSATTVRLSSGAWRSGGVEPLATVNHRTSTQFHWTKVSASQINTFVQWTRVSACRVMPRKRKEAAHARVRLRRGDHRLGLRRKRCRAPCGGEGLPGGRHGGRPALEGRGHSEDQLESAVILVAPRSGDVRDAKARVPRRRARPLRRRRGRRLAYLRQHACTSRRSSSSTPRDGQASPTGPTNWRRVSTRRRRMLGVVRYPYMPTDVDRYMQQVAIEMGNGETFNKAPVGVYFGSPGVEADDPYFGGVGPRRTGCIGCGNCSIGCGHNAKNKLTTNYLYLAEKLGVEIHELHEVYDLVRARWRRVRGACASSRLGAASGPPPPPHVHRRAGDRRRTRVWLGEAASSHAAQGPAAGPLERARATSADELRTADLHHADLTESGSAIRRRSTSRRGRSRSPRVSGRMR